MIQIFLIAREILDTLYRNDEKKEDHEESESEDEPAKEKKKSFPEIVDKVIKVINLGFGLGQDLNQVEEIEELDEVREGTAEGEMMEDAEQTKTINEVIEEVPIKLTDEELKQKMKASLGMMIEQQALGQLEGGPK